tara:strand:+ start:115 stop:1383 length:1269 start_codon:yes stop_codon:yes gene_type:complete
MPSTYTDSGGIEKIGLGEKAGAWGTTTNNNFDIIDRLINGVGAITLSGTTHTLTTSDGSLSDGMFKVLVLGGSPSGTNTITISPNDADKLYFVKNGTSQTATFTQGSGADVSVAAGEAAIVFADGAGSGAAVTDLSTLFPMKTGVAGSFTTVTASSSLLPDASGGADIGSTSLEWGDIYIADDKKIKFGSDQDISMEYDEDGTDSLLISGGDVTIADDKKLFFGTDKDVSIEYDEDGNNTMLVTGDVVFADGSTSVDIKSHDLSANGLKLDGTLVTSSAAEINKLDGVTATTTELNYTDGVSSNIQTQLNTKHSAVGQGLQEDDATTVAMKNSWMSTSSAIFSISGTSFTNSRSYPVFIVGRSNAGGGSFSFTVTNGGGGSGTVAQQDGDSGTNDPFSFILPVGGSISGSSFTGTGIELRPA